MFQQPDRFDLHFSQTHFAQVSETTTFLQHEVVRGPTKGGEASACGRPAAAGATMKPRPVWLGDGSQWRLARCLLLSSLFVLLLGAEVVLADLPIHCLHHMVAGSWEFELSEPSPEQW